MNFNLKNFIIASVLVVFLFLSVTMVSASSDVAGDNLTDVESVQEDLKVDEVSELQEDVGNSDSNLICEDAPAVNEGDAEIKTATKIESNSPSVYYKEKGELITYLKDDNNKPVGGKKLSISLDGKTYFRTTDKAGKAVLNVNLKPDTYYVKIRFDGDSEFSSSSTNTVIKVLKTPLSLKTSNFKTYWHSGLFFKAKVINKITQKPINGIKVVFKVYSGNKLYKKVHAVTDKNGVAYLKKNLKVGTYKVRTYIQDRNQKPYMIYKNSDKRVTMKVMPTAEMGCCSIYLQVGTMESVTGFRRDSSYEADIKVENVKWYGRAAIKQYKTIGTYFFHTIVTADGWSIGTGGVDGPGVNRAIEKMAAKMVNSNYIKRSTMYAIRDEIASLGYSIGHFAIKAPNGKYSIVWVNGYKSGKLNPGDYISVPNSQSCFRQGTYAKFSSNPVKAALKIAATDSYGINRRDILVYHWKTSTKEGSTSSYVKVYAANDNGMLSGRSTGYLKDDVYFDGAYYSKNSLPNAPSKKCIGAYNFGKIDMFKTQTIVKAPAMKISKSDLKSFKIKVFNKETNDPVGKIKIRVKVHTGNKYKIYTFKTSKYGIVRFDPSVLKLGKHKVYIFSANTDYFISKISTIVLTK